MNSDPRIVTARAPMRVSLAGGGTDLASYACRHGGLVVGLAIDRYVTVTVYPREFTGGVTVRHQEPEAVEQAGCLRDRFVAGALALAGRVEDVQVSVLSDAPAGTGLGGSGAFTVALSHALRGGPGERPDPVALAEVASAVEIEELERPVGKQDHYMAALGGLQALHIGRDGSVCPEALDLGPEVAAYLRDHLLLFFTGQTRDAGAVLAEQSTRTGSGDREVVRSLEGIHELARELRTELQAGRASSIGPLLAQHWLLKQRLSPAVSSGRISELHEAAMSAGATGAKLLGAGGGGFLLVAAGDGRQDAIRAEMRRLGADELPFGPAERGSLAVSLPL